MNLKNKIKDMTLEEKAGLLSGADFWHTKPVERLDIPSIMVSDGPHGLRKQPEKCDHMGVAESVKAVCFPTASALACSFDTDLLYEIGQALGDECQAENVSVLLGPGVNMKRSPLCGRNFEYFSEDPYVAGKIGAAMVSGVQSKHVGTCVKHFAANNQEYRRMSISVEADERTLREIYLSAFETIVKEAKPWTLMCSYNRINGVYSCENDWLQNKVLRHEWGFDGAMVTDWGAMNRRVDALQAGMDLEMPSSHGETDKQIVAAVKNGTLSEDVVDTAVLRILDIIEKYNTNKTQATSYDKEAHHALAKKASVESAVLLKNDGTLPLSKSEKVAIIGAFATTPRFQGGGSSHINCFKITNALDTIKEKGLPVSYAQGYIADKDEIDEELVKEAVSLSQSVDTVVIYAGLPDAFESEGYDRKHLELPENQTKLIEEICSVQKNVVIVLHNGSPVTMPWLDKVNAVLEMYLGGQAVGEASVDLLYGYANPCGKLAETFPLRLEDNPSFIDFPGEDDTVCYREGLFIGYRHYDKRKIPVLFPFGHGLSYATYKYYNLQIDKTSMKDTDTATVSVTVENTSGTFGKEIVQLYVQDTVSRVIRPIKELKGFTKVALAPGEAKTVTFTLDKRSFAYYNVKANDWFVTTGDYTILVGSSSADIRLKGSIHVEGTIPHPFVAGDTTTCEDIYLYAKDTSPLEELLKKSAFDQATNHEGNDDMGAGTAEMMKNMFYGTPLHSILSFNDTLTIEEIDATIQALNDAQNKKE